MTATNDKQKLFDFMEELNALLTKYDASINFTYEGDTHGIYNERCYIDFSDVEACRTNDTYLTKYNTLKKKVVDEFEIGVLFTRGVE